LIDELHCHPSGFLGYNMCMVNTIVTIMENGGRRITGTRISLDSVVHAYWNGQSIDEIVADFPSLTTAQVKDALEYYLQHRTEVDAYLAEQEQRWESLRLQNKKLDSLINRIHQSQQTPSV
jgi:uncharacterized protein (DUF433 family)